MNDERKVVVVVVGIEAFSFFTPELIHRMLHNIFTSLATP